ncbi:hypothetical protein LXL04_020301 [Taraxacum kok-saghyz]
MAKAPRAWYSRIESYFTNKGFFKCTHEHTLFMKGQEGKMLIVCVYVDDLVFTRNCEELINSFKEEMKTEFEMTNLGMLHYFLGIEV